MLLRLLIAASLIFLCRAEPTQDLITEPLPNWMDEPITFRQFSGYLNVSEYKQLYYWYVESQGDPTKDPVMLWLNGGPGCSSLQGMLLELGPFRVSDWGNSVTSNPWSWNRFSNIIFLDAPAGVGFSVRTDGLYNFTDDEVADDNHVAMLRWFEKFPERKPNDFYVMGESYAGTYVPMLSQRLVNDRANFPNFKGMAMGNGCVNDKLLFNSGIQYDYYHSLIDETIYEETEKKCCKGTSSTECDYYTLSKNHAEELAKHCAADILYLYGSKYISGLDPYFITYTCYLDGDPYAHTTEELLAVPEWKWQVRNAPTTRDIMQRHMFRKFFPKGDDPEHPDYDPSLPQCAHYNDYAIWLQLPELREVLHIPDSVPAYESCSTDVENAYQPTPDSDMTPYVNEVIDKGARVLLFNGDQDTMCNVIHNEQFLAQLGRNRTHVKHGWFDQEQKPPTVGFWTQYEGVDFLTIRGAGHFASSDDEKPKESAQMYYNFLKGQNYSYPAPGQYQSSLDSPPNRKIGGTPSPIAALLSILLIFAMVQ